MCKDENPVQLAGMGSIEGNNIDLTKPLPDRDALRYDNIMYAYINCHIYAI